MHAETDIPTLLQPHTRMTRIHDKALCQVYRLLSRNNPCRHNLHNRYTLDIPHAIAIADATITKAIPIDLAIRLPRIHHNYRYGPHT
jgi:hypothetical protein